MKIEVKTITPEFAKDVLENRNPRNREISDRLVNRFAREMRKGRWLTTHQGIAFDENDDLVDGQHRLQAVCVAGIPVKMLVATELPVGVTVAGLEIRTMDVIDTGKARTTAQQLKMSHGIPNANIVSSACLAVYHFIRPGKGNYTTTDILFCEDMLREDLRAVIGKLSRSRWRTGFMVGPMSLYRSARPEKADKFMSEILLLEPTISSPARSFLKWFERNHRGSNTGATTRVLAQCLRAYETGKQLEKVASDNELARVWLIHLTGSTAKDLRDFTTPLTEGKKGK